MMKEDALVNVQQIDENKRWRGAEDDERARELEQDKDSEDLAQHQKQRNLEDHCEQHGFHGERETIRRVAETVVETYFCRVLTGWRAVSFGPCNMSHVGRNGIAEAPQ